ncbi:hypothetical protein DM860_000749 [Cuscuta australis]|uniref:Anaphase-promoting complex subunit 5 n=1 Tax=Cuscuta australis TaxID=267555 RepID=A0A328CXA6_9ASTE|nr:hypothetical protein DM860_000749 [Cuscuta australis]
MAGIVKPPGAFTVTPHKVSVCILVSIYAPPEQDTIPFPFTSVSQHNGLALYLIALIKSCEDIFEPKLDELIEQLPEISGTLHEWLSENLKQRLSSIDSPDDLFNFFNELQDILGGSESNEIDDDQISLDPSSNIGMFVRRCLLAFNNLSFEAVCHLVSKIKMYVKESLSTSPPYDLLNFDNTDCSPEEQMAYEKMELESIDNEKIEVERVVNEQVPFHNHAPKLIVGLVEGNDVYHGTKAQHIGKSVEFEPSGSAPCGASNDSNHSGEVFLRTNWQIQGYLMEQAGLFEKLGSPFILDSFDFVLQQLQKLAPELHRVHFLRYLNSLYHDDYPTALQNINRYFDYSAGTEGCDYVAPPSSAGGSFGRFQVALLCLGMAHFHFGHPQQALEVLSEAVRVSQLNSDDTCLAYTLTTICKLLSNYGLSNTTGFIGSSYSPVAYLGTSMSVQQQLYVLLKSSLKRAERQKLKRLVASNHLAMAKFDLTHIQRPLLLFGPKASMKLTSCPINVCKELRLSSHLITDFGDETSTMTSDGAFCTAWLNDLKKPNSCHIFHQENESISNNRFHFCAQSSSIPGSVLQLVGSSYLVRATAWEVYGSAPLARINSLVFAACFSDSSSSEDVGLAYAKLIQHLAVYKGYKEAFAALKIAEEKFLCLSKSRVQLVKLQLLHEHALHQGHLKLAQRLCDELGAYASSVAGVDMEIKAEASFRHARTLLASNQFSEAAAVAHTLFCMCYKFSLQVENATTLLLLAEIHKKSGNAVLGIPYALASLSFCQSFNLDLLKASATLTLAELWLSLGSTHAERALSLLHTSFPILLGHGGLELRARAFIVEAKCYLADSSFSVHDEPENVLQPLRQASEDLERLEYHELAAETFHLMAVIYDKLGKDK